MRYRNSGISYNISHSYENNESAKFEEFSLSNEVFMILSLKIQHKNISKIYLKCEITLFLQ